MKINLNPTEIYHNFLKEYQDIKEVKRADGKGVGYQFSDNTYLSFTPEGERDQNKTSLGAWETFYRQGFIAIHNVSGLAIKVYPFDIPTV